MAAAIESDGLRKLFGRREAVAGVDLRVPEGGVYAFLGRNGAGKTTTIRLMLGLLRPTAGRVRVFGRDVARERIAAARSVGSLVETPAIYDRLTGRENLDIQRRMLGAPRSEVDRVLGVVDLRDAAGRMAGGYSLGMRQRLGLARALIGRPRLLVLDEPANGLDPDGIREMRELLRALPEQDGITVFVSSHLLNEIEQIATHVGLMHAGRLLAQSTLAELKGTGGRELEADVEDAPRAAAALAGAGMLAWATDARSLGVSVPERATGDRFAAEVNRVLVERGFVVSRLLRPEPSLEQVYLRMVSAERGDTAPTSPAAPSPALAA